MYKILILDDEDYIRESLACYFEDDGYEVLTAESTEQAIEIIKNTKIDVVLVDLRLPGKSGEEFIVDAYPETDNTSFIIYSGSTDFILSPKLKTLSRVSKKIFRKPLDDMEFLNKEIEFMINNLKKQT